MPTAIQQSVTSLAGTQQTSTSSAILGKDDFLKMLVVQMRNQDPLDPMKGTEFASQLAQFSSVEQLSNINQNLQQSLDSNAILTKSISNALAATFIGKEVRAQTDNYKYGGTGSTKLGYNLPSNADTVTIKILNSQGNVIRTVNGAESGIGEHNFQWDGKDDSGTQMTAGTYSFTIDAKDSAGAAINVDRFVYGTVQGVRYKADGTVFVIDGAEVPLSSIMEIMGASANGG
jgi:flagellar basal-body rod modification protein FlgD